MNSLFLLRIEEGGIAGLVTGIATGREGWVKPEVDLGVHERPACSFTGHTVPGRCRPTLHLGVYWHILNRLLESSRNHFNG